ncbi:flagellar protein FlaG [Conexibacter stalactiti]|uniref:Flagellar protein FlaG n=1 Tax=Conexibacter stalactiti TaxID=1940611 RepID=A0ABU4HY81_9ACTN|nr:flagellar protein FlaG [Conexibacter stalactiti]MDW5597019.1 flagellar protein FlaG [Conexibacter stalactiti]MEC5037661.1 flagellar protein FlaG [Conexibacter stalactiti]
MSLDVAPVGPSSYRAGNEFTSLPRGVRSPAATHDVGPSGDVPSSPPQQVLDAMDAASRAYQALREQGRELRFAQDADTGRMTIEVRDMDGNLLRMIPPSKLLDVATGGILD